MVINPEAGKDLGGADASAEANNAFCGTGQLQIIFQKRNEHLRYDIAGRGLVSSCKNGQVLLAHSNMMCSTFCTTVITAATIIIVAIWLKFAAGRIIPSMSAPGKL